MENAIKLALLLLRHFRANEPPARRGIRTVGAILLLVAAMTLAIAAVGCAIAALWFFSVPYAGEAGASLIAAAALFLIAGGVVGAAALLLQRKHRVPAPGLLGGEGVGEDIILLATSLLAGFLAGKDGSSGSR